jgi:hypothetical protein
MTMVVGFCPHCMGLRNMRATQGTRHGAGYMQFDWEFIMIYHCESCGLFVEDESFRTASWDELINSLDKFSADFIAERKQPKLQNR